MPRPSLKSDWMSTIKPGGDILPSHSHQWEGEGTAYHFRNPAANDFDIPPRKALVYDAWLEVDGIVISYISLIDTDRPKGPIFIRMIETREGYRRQGWATRLIEETKVYLRRPLRSYGQYTPDGFAALLGKVKLADGKSVPTGPEVHQQAFVKDWDGKYGPIPG